MTLARMVPYDNADMKRRETLKRELEWIRSSPKAKQSKGRARLNAYEELRKQADEGSGRLEKLEIAIPPGDRLGDVVINFDNVSKAYDDRLLIDDLSFKLPPAGIVGVIGANGAGKTTLLKMIAGYLRKSAGEIQVFAEHPFNSLKVSANTIFVDDRMCMPTNLSLAETLQTARQFYTNWDEELAQRLFRYFSLPAQQNYSTLSKGMKSTFNLIIALSARCPLTILDEPTSGMDSAIRKDFYRALLKDYIAHPRTIILSSHLLGEVEHILEHILLIKEGELCLHQSIDDLKQWAIGLQGQADTVLDAVKNKEVYFKDHLGKDSMYAAVKNDFTQSNLQEVKAAGIVIQPVAVDDLCNYLTNATVGGIDDVFNRA
jgi:ABC-2 type transport system ATP-binding protein